MEHVGVVRVALRSAASTRGVLLAGPLRLPCAIGRSGVRARKREGDGGTPRGTWRLTEAWYRPDRAKRPRTALPLRAVRPCEGWCDAADDRNYNRRVRLPYPASAETMWRGDRLYDIGAVLGYNVRPRRRGRGSAIFLHVAREGWLPTEGCIALEQRHLVRLLAMLGRNARIRIG